MMMREVEIHGIYYHSSSHAFRRLKEIDSFVKTPDKVMSYTENSNNDQNNVLHIGPQIELEEEEVKQMKNSTNLNITCCKSSSGKVCVYVS